MCRLRSDEETAADTSCKQIKLYPMQFVRRPVIKPADRLTHRADTVDRTREAVVGYGCIPGLYGPHGLTVEKKGQHTRCHVCTLLKK